MKNTIKILFGILAIGIILISGCAPKEKTEEKLPPVEEGKEDEKVELMQIKSVIEMSCAEGIVHYKESITWNQEPEEVFKKSLIESFKESIINHGIEVKDCSVKLEGNSTILSCSIHCSFQGSWYDFDWFLRPRGLDFLDTPFERREQELVWEGILDGVYTTIIIGFPWSISNCHEHVWKR